jgi:hypothetical protein
LVAQRILDLLILVVDTGEYKIVSFPCMLAAERIFQGHQGVSV